MCMKLHRCMQLHALTCAWSITIVLFSWHSLICDAGLLALSSAAKCQLYNYAYFEVKNLVCVNMSCSRIYVVILFSVLIHGEHWVR